MVQVTAGFSSQEELSFWPRTTTLLRMFLYQPLNLSPPRLPGQQGLGCKGSPHGSHVLWLASAEQMAPSWELLTKANPGLSGVHGKRV